MKLIHFENYSNSTATSTATLDLNVRVLARQPRIANELDRLLSAAGSASHTQGCYAGDTPLRDELKDDLPDVVILEIQDGREETLDDIRGFVESRGRECEVFVTLPEPDLELVKLLIRSGVRDVLSQPISSQDLAIALSSAMARQGKAAEPAHRKGKVVAFMSTKGNAGSSLLAVNTAWQLASSFGRRTVLVDMDIQFGTVASELDVEPDSGLLEALHNPERIDKVFLSALTTRHASGLEILPSPGDLSDCENLSASAVDRLLKVLSESHDHVVINLPVHLNDAVEQVFRLSHPVYLVTQDTLSSLRNLRMILQRLPLRGVPASNLEVIHYRLDRKLKDVKAGDLKKLIGDIPLHLVNGDYRLAARAENEGKAVSELHPASELVKSIHCLAGGLAAAENEQQKTAGRKGLFGLFS